MSTKKLLIIEDDSIVSNLYRGVFEKEGFQVEVCSSGQDGFFKIHERRPDVVLLDLMLPVMGGAEILRKIRAQKAFETLPVIVFTNAYLPDMIQDALKAGARQVNNTATVNPRELVAAVRAAMDGAEVPPVPVDPAAAAKSASTPAAGGLATSSIGGESARPSGNMALAEFQASAPGTVARIRNALQACVKATDESTKLNGLDDIYRLVRSLTSQAALAGMRGMGQMCSAIEALLRELLDKPKSITASTMRTLAHAVDFLGVMVTSDNAPLDRTPISVLVVDDEPLSRKALVLALERAFIRPISLSNPHLVLDLLPDNRFDLIILDVEMPGITGHDLCVKIREFPHYKTTPVIFVTSLSDFESRAKSTVSGGDDFMAKPFIFMEINVKVLTFVFKARLAAGGA
jgi:DNA-binding response OmpR family regulator